MGAKDDVIQRIDDRAAELARLATDIWEHPEPGFQEAYAAGLITSVLEREGFAVHHQVAGIPNAFVAEWGSGRPVVGVLGEYDALPGLSQKVSATREPVSDGAAGHACGHNLLGVAGLGAVLGARSAMELSHLPGTIRYYGCPAEETLMGKVFMAREGLFADLDAVLTWHPMYANTLWSASSAALNSFKLSFHGVSAHAGAAPEAGRSALDAVMLTDVGVNFLREHIPTSVRMHCVVTHGGEAPNIVPAFAQSWYYVRAADRALVTDVYERVLDVARGAALMTGTRLEVELVAACHDYLPNRTLEAVLLSNMKQIGPPDFSSEDTEFAAALVSTLPAGMADDAVKTLGRSRDELGGVLCTRVFDS
ncbi:MAG: amidohydrolase, partial [Chloroflexota bacterium]